MPNLNFLNQQIPDSVPMAAPIARATAITGLSKTAIYKAAAVGRIRLLKLGRSTLVDLASAQRFIQSLPEAAIRRRA